MICDFSNKEIFDLVSKQVGNFWPVEISDKDFPSLGKTLARIDKNFRQRKSGVFCRDGESVFSVAHTVQYTVFLYTYANQLYKDGNEKGAAQVYYLNKIMNSVDWLYAIELPEIFSAEHPLGSVLGRAKYSNYLFLYHGTTIGGNINKGKLCYPEIGERVLLYSDSKILGDTVIGNNVIVSANSYLLNEKIPDNSIVFGQSPDITVKTLGEDEIKEKMSHLWA